MLANLDSRGLGEVIPFLREPVDFLATPLGPKIFRPFMTDPGVAATFHFYRGEEAEPARDLPWLDVNLAILIAASRIPGDDVAIALDYRVERSAPRVVASDWSDGRSCQWRPVAPSFRVFAALLGLTG